MAATDTVERESAGARARRASAPRVHSRERERVLDGLTVVLPTLLAIGLCLYELTTRSLWLDEAATVSIVRQHGGAFASAVAHDGGNMLGYYGLLHVLVGWFGA